MNKKIISAALGVVMAAMSCGTVFAADTENVVLEKNDITKSETFVTTDSNFKHDFEERITENGKKFDLKGINYEVVSSKKLERSEPILHTVNYDNLYFQNEEPPETLTIVKDGQNVDVQLSDMKYTPMTITNRAETLSAYTDFDYKTTEPNVPPTKTITYFDNASGKNVTATLNFKELKEVDPWAWRDDVNVPITFSIYEAEYYALGDKFIPYNNYKPAIQGYEADLLDELKLDKEKYKIDDVSWDGEAYTIGEVTYRKAIAHGQRYAANYVAVYEDSVSLPNAPGFSAVATYESAVSVLNGETEYTVKATAIYSPVSSKAILFVGISFAAIMMILLISVILYVVSKRREEKGDEKDGETGTTLAKFLQ